MHFHPFQVHEMKVKIKNKKKTMQIKRRRFLKSKINLILSHVNHTFFILNSQIGPQAFRHNHYTLRKNICLM
jgi:hypothetical protein